MGSAAGEWGTCLGDDLLEEPDVIAEGPSAGLGQGVTGGGAAALEGFGDGDVAGLEECAEVGGGVAIGHAQGVSDLGEEQGGGGGKERHDREPAFLVDRSIQLEEGFGVHAPALGFSVAAR